MRATVEFDGGAAPTNPGPAFSSALLWTPGGFVVARARAIGAATNNFAEYVGLHMGLQLAEESLVTHLSIVGDSKLVIMQIRGEWDIGSDSLRPLAESARRRLERFASWDAAHVGRSENALADGLANKSRAALVAGVPLTARSPG